METARGIDDATNDDETRGVLQSLNRLVPKVINHCCDRLSTSFPCKYEPIMSSWILTTRCADNRGDRAVESSEVVTAPNNLGAAM